MVDVSNFEPFFIHLLLVALKQRREWLQADVLKKVKLDKDYDNFDFFLHLLSSSFFHFFFFLIWLFRIEFQALEVWTDCNV